MSQDSRRRSVFKYEQVRSVFHFRAAINLSGSVEEERKGD
jgi:hypothetical protein